MTGIGRSEAPCVFLIYFNFFAKDGGSFPASLFQNRLFCVSCSYKMTQFEIYVNIYSAQSVKRLHFSLQTTKTGPLLCSSLFLCYVFSFDCLFFWAQFFLSLFALPSYATCRC